MKYLGIDLGSRTMGLALSDITGTIASSYKVIRHDEDYNSLIPIIGEIINKESVSEVVLGLPKNMNNTLGEKANLSYEFRDMIEQQLGIKVHLIDERLTTKQATDILLLHDTSRKKRKQVVDSIAAAIILQSYLDSKERKN